MALVVDASVTVAWYIKDEITPFAVAVLARLRQEGAVVPGVWPLEVLNALLVAERRRRLTPAQTVRALRLLQELPITVVDRPLSDAADIVLPLAREQGLTTYDASYVALALREGLPLAAGDGRMRAAATRLGVALVDVQEPVS